MPSILGDQRLLIKVMDLSDKVSICKDKSRQTTTPEMISIEIQSKTCVDCGTTKTPLWRVGPAGPKSLCNACGIRNRKKRRALLELNKENKKIKKSSASENKNNQKPSSNNCTSNNGDSTNNTNVKKKLSLQRSRSNSTHWKNLGEVERAAFLLMSLSCGSVFV